MYKYFARKKKTSFFPGKILLSFEEEESTYLVLIKTFSNYDVFLLRKLNKSEIAFTFNK